MAARRPTNPLLTMRPVIPTTQSSWTNFWTGWTNFWTVNATWIAILFISCDSCMVVIGMLIYDSNQFYCARSFFVGSLAVNALAYYGMWRRSALAITPCLLVYIITNLAPSCVVAYVALRGDYDRLSRFFQDTYNLDYELSHTSARFAVYNSMRSALQSIVYQSTLVYALWQLRSEYVKETQILDRVVPSNVRSTIDNEP